MLDDGVCFIDRLAFLIKPFFTDGTGRTDAPSFFNQRPFPKNGLGDVDGIKALLMTQGIMAF
jgi:hypothetical protein